MSNDASGNSPKSKRGGKRPGAGRKPKGYVKPAAISQLNRVQALASEPPVEIDSVAQTHAKDAIEAFVKILFNGSSEPARISAAKEILDRGYGKPAVEIGGDAAPMLPFMMRPASVDTISVTEEVRLEARRYANLAIKTLHTIATNGASETAVAAAAKALLDRGLGTVGKARMIEDQKPDRLGKKEEIRRAAVEATASGIFSPRQPPRNAVARAQ